ncbi:hypothetical protein [Paractinoplanes globisporus]|uniref:Uncharacterized protein n=1 Tax=Paractinoplanes globisporus TaxID=113565 RepID=A0ABW6WVL0_9ACTN|nr:hypothetical protein [Actinoplanes globisporus]
MTDSKASLAADSAPDGAWSANIIRGGTQHGPVIAGTTVHVSFQPSSTAPSTESAEPVPSAESFAHSARRRAWLIPLAALGVDLLILGIAGCVRLGWDKADKAASVGSFVVAVLGLICSITALLQSRRTQYTSPTGADMRAGWFAATSRHRYFAAPTIAAALILGVGAAGLWRLWLTSNASANDAAQDQSSVDLSVPLIGSSTSAAESISLPSEIRPAAGQTAYRLTFQLGRSYDLARPDDQDPNPEVADLEYRDGKYLAVPLGNATTMFKHLSGPKSLDEAMNSCPRMGLDQDRVNSSGLDVDHILCVRMADGRRALLQVQMITPGGPLTVLVVVASGWPRPALEPSKRTDPKTSPTARPSTGPTKVINVAAGEFVDFDSSPAKTVPISDGTEEPPFDLKTGPQTLYSDDSRVWITTDRSQCLNQARTSNRGYQEVVDLTRHITPTGIATACMVTTDKRIIFMSIKTLGRDPGWAPYQIQYERVGNL